MSGDDTPALDRRRALLAVGAAALLGAGAVALVGVFADFGEMLRALRRADAIWFLGCVAGQVAAYCGYVLAYRDVARADGGPRLPYRTVARVVLAGFGATAVGSAPGGLAVDFWALHRAGADTHEAARRVLAFNTLEWAVVAWIAAAAGALALAGQHGGAPHQQAIAWAIIAPVASILGAALGTERNAERMAARRRSGIVPRLRNAFADVLGCVALVKHVVARPHRYPAALAGFTLFWAGQLLTLYGGLSAFGAGDVAPAAFVLAFVTGYVATALPLPAGGAGSIEASMAASLHLAGIALAPALLAVLVYRFFTFWLPLLPALAVLPGLPKLRADLRNAPREARRATS